VELRAGTGDEAAYRLVHDTLAPLVRDRFQGSLGIGPRARRILEKRSLEWANGLEGAPLDRHDLEIVEKASAVLPAWSEDDDRLIRVSREVNRRRLRLLRTWQGVGSAAVLTLLTVTIWIQFASSQHKAKTRSEGLQSVFKATQAFAKGNLPEARVQLTTVLTAIRDEPALEGEFAEAKRLLSTVDLKLENRARLNLFDRWRDEVLFLATESLHADTGPLVMESVPARKLLPAPQILQDDSGATQKRAVEAAREAFASVGLSLQGDGRLNIDPSFAPAEREAIESGGYELLLVLSDALLSMPASGLPPEHHRLHASEARRILDRAVALRPPTRAYYRRKARCLDSLGDKRAADAQRALADARPTIDALDDFLAGVDLFLFGQGKGGRRDLRDAIRDLEKATRDFEQAIQARPDHFWARFYLAICSLYTHRPAMAISQLTACLDQKPNYIWTLLLRGVAWGQLHDFDAAQADFAQITERGLDEDQLYALLVNRAAVRVGPIKRKDALADLERAIALRPDRYRAYVNRALLLKQEESDESYKEANRLLEKAISLAPPDLVLTTLRTERAALLWRMGQAEDALHACDDLLDARPNTTEALGVRAAALLKLERYQASACEFTNYLKRGGEPTADIFSGRGQARMKLEDYTGAVDDYTLALLLQAGDNDTRTRELQPDWAIRNHRGWAYFFAGAHKLALNDFETALQRKPPSVDPVIGRGLARVELGQVSEAVEDARAALKGPCDDPTMLFNIACIFGRAASRDDPASQYPRQSVAVLRQALSLLPAAERLKFWEQVLKDDFLRAVRGRPEFKELEMQLERDFPGAIHEPTGAPSALEQGRSCCRHLLQES
jgi:tetratricopeptide (TPR) repeat protein